MANLTQHTRREKVLLLLKRNGFMALPELARQCDVSEMTLRRDLKAMAHDNKVNIVYGGATLVRSEGDFGNYQLNDEQDRNIQKKVAIAKAAVTLVNPGEVLFFDSGSTCQRLAHELTDEKPYTILCFSLNILEAAMSLMNSNVVVTGGDFYRRSMVFYGPESTATLQRYRINKAFLGARGFHARMGITCTSREAIVLKRSVIGNSLEKILLIDSSKFGKVVPFHFADFTDISTVVTDSDIPEEYAEFIKEKGMTLIVAKIENTEA